MYNLFISQKVIIDPHGQKLDALEMSYTSYFDSLGIMLHTVSNFTKDLDTYLSMINYDGLILSGGGDVNPACYISKGSKDFNYFPERERTETCLVKRMVEEKKPILGICHGMHQLNCFFGGKIIANIHENEKPARRKPKLNHRITIGKPSFGLSGQYEVNHYHNDGIKKSCLADCFDVLATDSDFGNIEGCIHKDLPIIAIQWHPERTSPDPEINKRLICGIFKIKV